jgi:hypothetical protein
VQIAGTLRSDQGTQLAANYSVAAAGTTLGRPFAGLGSPTITVNLVEPGTLYGDRVNQVDMRFAKVHQRAASAVREDQRPAGLLVSWEVVGGSR